jgi:hypothetical protein
VCELRSPIRQYAITSRSAVIPPPRTAP